MQFRAYDELAGPSKPSVIASSDIFGIITKGKWYDVHGTRISKGPAPFLDSTQYEIIDDSGALTYVSTTHFRKIGQRLPESTGKVESVLTSKIASDGGSTSYYDIPENAKTLYDLIEHRDMNFSEGNVFKAVYRMGTKEGVDPLYDWKKIKFCAEREIARLEKLTASEKKDG